MTQNAKILAALKRGEVLTQRKVARRWEIFRLSPRILELKRKGHDIRSTMIERGGKRFAAYRLA